MKTEKEILENLSEIINKMFELQVMMTKNESWKKMLDKALDKMLELYENINEALLEQD